MQITAKASTATMKRLRVDAYLQCDDELSAHVTLPSASELLVSVGRQRASPNFGESAATSSASAGSMELVAVLHQ